MSILAIVTVFCTTYAMILPAVTLASLPSLTDDGAYVSVFRIDSIVDGVAPFDTKNPEAPGNDADASNRKVRTFDSVTYKLFVEMKTHDSKQYGEARVKFEFVLPLGEQEACFDQSNMLWMDQTSNYAPKLTTEENRQVLTCYRHLLPGEDADAVLPGYFTVSVVINVKAMKNGKKITPQFSVCMEKGEWDKDKCEAHNIQEKFTLTDNSVTVTAAPKYNIQLAGTGAYKSTFDFKSGNDVNPPKAANYSETERYAVGRLMKLGVTLQLYGDDASKGLKGVELPDGTDITFRIDVSSKYTYTDESGTNTQVDVTETYTPLLWSCDANSKTEYGETNADGRTIYDEHGSAIGYAPFASGGGDKACYNSGSWSAVQNGSVITVTVKGYTVNTDSFPIHNGDGAGNYDANIGCFSAGELWILQPFNKNFTNQNPTNEIENDYRPGGAFATTVTASNLTVTSLSGTQSSQEQSETDNSAVMTLGIYQEGKFVNRIKYANANEEYIEAGLGLIAETSERARDGQDVATIGTQLRLHGGFTYSAESEENNQMYFGTNLTKFYGNALKVVTTAENYIYNHSNIPNTNFQVLFATKKDGTDWASDDELQTTYEDDLDFYANYEDIPEGDICVGVLFCFKGPVADLNSEKYYMGSVLVQIPADMELAGKTYMLASTSRMWTKSMFGNEYDLNNLPNWTNPDTKLSDFPAEHYKSANIEGSTFYIKETYAADGSGALGTHNSDWGYWGDTLLITGYRAWIEKTLSQQTGGEPKTIYDVSQNQRVVDFTLTPHVSINASGVNVKYYETITVVDTLPKYLTYRPGSCYVGGTYNQTDPNGGTQGTVEDGTQVEPNDVVVNEDGTTTLTWVFEDQRITMNTADAMGKIYYSAYIGSNNPEDDIPVSTTIDLINSAAIYAPLDLRTPTTVNQKYVEVGIQVIKAEASAYGKYVKQDVVEPDGTVDYVLYYDNNSAAATQILMLDAMPVDGKNSSVFTGSYTVTGWKLNVDKCNVSGLKFYYTVEESYAGATVESLDGETAAKTTITTYWKPANIAADGTVSTENNEQPIAWAVIGTLDGNKSVYIDLQIKLNPASSQNEINYFVNTLSVKDTVISAETHTVLRSLEGITWLDNNSDGIRDNGEALLDNVNVSLYKLNEGTIFTSDNSWDPMLAFKEILFTDLTAENLKRVRMTASGITEGEKPQLYYGTVQDNNLNEAKSIKLSPSTTAEEQELVFDFTSHENAAWAGQIKQIRIDPINTANKSFTIKNVVFELKDGTERVYDFTKKDEYKKYVNPVNISNVSYPDVNDLFYYSLVKSDTKEISCSTGEIVSALNGNPQNYEPGRYKFTDLPAGTYAVKFEGSTISGYIASPANRGNNDLYDSDGIAVYSPDRSVLNHTYITGIVMPTVENMKVTVFNSGNNDSGFYERGYELPKSGGSGTASYTVTGLLLCGLAGVIYIYNYPKKTRRS